MRMRMSMKERCERIMWGAVQLRVYSTVTGGIGSALCITGRVLGSLLHIILEKLFTNVARFHREVDTGI